MFDAAIAHLQMYRDFYVIGTVVAVVLIMATIEYINLRRWRYY